MGPSASESTPGSSADDQGARITVLVVDDDPEFVDLTTEFLEREDDRFTVVTATSASDGLDELATADVDCVVSDYDMPRTNGVEFLRTVRDDYPDLPFILFTGKGSEEVASEAISDGVTDYLQKGQGVSQYELLANRITNAVEQTRARRQADKHRRVSTVVREINRALVEATTREEISHRVCQIFTDADPYVFAWVGTVNSEPSRIEPQAAAGGNTGYLDEVTITTDDSPTGQAPCGTAISENRVVVSEILDDESVEPWREVACDCGYRSMAAIPLTYDDTQYGLLAVYADRSDAFDESERGLLSELGDTIAHAYHRIDIQGQYEDQYRALFEQAPVMFTITREVGEKPIIEDCNRVFAETLGYTREELRGRPLVDVYTEESAQALLDEGGYDRALAGEFERERRDVVTSDGEVVETLLRATPRRNTDGEIIGTHALFVDISDQAHVQSLESLRERMEFALEATDSTLFEIDLDTGQLTRHGPFERLYGIPPDRIETSKAFHEQCVHPDDRDTLRKIRRREYLAETDGSVSCDFRTNPAHGEERWVHFEAYATVGPDGTPQRLVGLDIDVTERKKREQALEKIQQRTQTMMQTATTEETAQVAVDTAREVLDAELSGCHLRSDDGQMLEPIAFVDTVRETGDEPPTYDRTADGDPQSRIVWDAFERGEPLVVDDTREHDGLAEVTPARSSVIHPLDEYGVFIVSATEPNGFDETQQTLIEIVATALTTALDRVDRERELERQNERLDQFASVISHDLRNPLNAAQLQFDLVREDVPEDNARKVEQNLDRMEAMIDDLLTMSRAGETVEAPETVSLKIRASIAWDHVDTAGAALDIEVSDETIVLADGNRLLRLFENLFRNAVDHTTAPLTVRVGELDTTAGDDTLTGFFVEDDGDGIPDDEAEEVFEYGYTTSDDGIGLGLSIVQEIVEAHGWDIAVTEGSNGGARFEITNVETAEGLGDRPSPSDAS